ncbi:hypothetical protein EZ313_17350 [Ramlibacter henchirensis]|uniref:Uncharacterized protein n=1 Tax=Ramlibacter henchirensis TaxID=204072 RepID=A0A4Z0BYI1_9BURK|nr:hypothetical protein EZ313_17350 [Ramlibacter henchirensis]
MREIAPSPSAITFARTALRVLQTAAVVLAALTPLGLLYGYGVALGLASRLGLDPGVFFNSVLDLLVLAGRGLLGHFLFLLKALDDLGSDEILEAGAVCGLAVLVLSLLAAAAYFVVQHLVPRLRNSELWRAVTQAFDDATVRPIVKFFSLAVFIAMASGAALRWLSLVAALALLTVLSAAPMLGMSGADNYLAATVFQADSCLPGPGTRWAAVQRPQQRRSRATRYAATCVEVVPATGAVLRGRLVLARGENVVLYRPRQDDALVLDLKGARLIQLSTLQTGTGEQARDPSRTLRQ